MNSNKRHVFIGLAVSSLPPTADCYDIFYMQMLPAGSTIPAFSVRPAISVTTYPRGDTKLPVKFTGIAV